MKASLITKERGYKLIPISLSKSGLRQFKGYEAKKAYLVKYVGVRPKLGRRLMDNCITVLIKGQKETQTWHKTFFNVPHKTFFNVPHKNDKKRLSQ